MSLMNLNNKCFYIAGVANKKSVAYFVAKILIEAGSNIILSAQNDLNLQNIQKLFPKSPSFILDVENTEDMSNLTENLLRHTDKIDGFLHSMAFANFSEGPKPFHETKLENYLQACHISCFSFTQISNKLIPLLTNDASVVTVSISNTKATSYGYLGPIKAMLETSVAYLSKSFSEFSEIRFNSVAAGPLKTSASAGIPNYIENYLYAEQLTLRKKAIKTNEVASTIVFLLSSLSSGINAENLVVDGGMNVNYFDQDIVKKFSSL
jgi:enoyl-[acyl-carrier protein] reductase I